MIAKELKAQSWMAAHLIFAIMVDRKK